MTGAIPEKSHINITKSGMLSPRQTCRLCCPLANLYCRPQAMCVQTRCLPWRQGLCIDLSLVYECFLLVQSELLSMATGTTLGSPSAESYLPSVSELSFLPLDLWVCSLAPANIMGKPPQMWGSAGTIIFPLFLGDFGLTAVKQCISSSNQEAIILLI